MSARRPTLRLLAASAALLCSTSSAEEAAPDPEFLLYLGSWEGADEEWTMFIENDVAAEAGDERSEPVPAGDDSQEHDDEA